MGLDKDLVLIVGAGPTGMTAAMELARFGIPVRLVEKTKAPATTSRAVGVQARTLELMQQRGLADKFLAIGNPAPYASAYGQGKRVFRLDFSAIDSSYGYIFFISQAETERILREQLAVEGVIIERGLELVAFAQTESHSEEGEAGGVTAVLRHDDGALEQVSAAYMISADGAHSLSRTTLGIQFGGKPLPDDYALGDLYVEGDLAPTDLHLFSSDEGFLGLFPMGGSHFRLIASNPPAKADANHKPSLEELQGMYDERSHIPAKFHDLTWSSSFHINSRMVDRMSQGRVFLGGDAAHIHSPSAAQGMNTGIQDMVNLCWKLAMVMKGQASHELLQTYGEDRIPVIRNVLSKTEGLTAAIGSHNHLFREIFDHVAPLAVGTEFVQKKSATRMSQIGLNYRGSSLSETHGHHGALHAGDRVPDMLLTVLNKEGSAEQSPHAERLLSLLHPDSFTLLYVNIDDPPAVHASINSELAPWKALMPGHQIAASRSDTKAADHFVEQFGDPAAIILVRPDGYIGVISRTNDIAALVAYARKWLGKGSLTAPPQPSVADHHAHA